MFLHQNHNSEVVDPPSLEHTIYNTDNYVCTGLIYANLNRKKNKYVW